MIDDLFRAQQEWSRETFGSPERRGPKGPLLHLAKEAAEAAAAPDDIEEYADCLILVMDAAWRAGWTLRQLMHAVEQKQCDNRHRDWPPPDAQTPDQPVEHRR